MFRFAILVLAGIGLGAILFGSAPSAGVGLWFLAAIPLFIFFKIMLIATFFGLARRRFNGPEGKNFEHPWEWRGRHWQAGPSRRRRKDKETTEKRPSDNDRFEEWHRMAHAKEEVAGWADEPE